MEQSIIQSLSIKYQFKFPIYKVSHIYPSSNGSIVILASKNHPINDWIIKYDKQGNVVFQFDLKNWSTSICMSDKDTIYVARVEDENKNTICQINLKQHKVSYYYHEFQFQTQCQVQLNYFYQSRLLCVRQVGDYSNSKVILTYYNVPLKYCQNQQNINRANPLIVFNSEPSQNIWDPSYNIIKADSHSRYIWHKSNFKQIVVIRTYWINKWKGEYAQICVKTDSLSVPYQIQDNFQLAINQLWMISNTKLILFCSTNKNQLNKCNPPNIVINTFKWDFQLNIISQVDYYFHQKYQDLLIDMIGNRQISMFRTFYCQPGTAVPSPAYFVDNFTQTVIFQQQWTCSHLQKYYIKQYQPYVICEAIYDNQNVQQISLRQIRFVNRRNRSLFLLQNLAKNHESTQFNHFDDNLIQQAIMSLDYMEFEQTD